MNQPASLPLVASLLAAPLAASGIAWLDAARQENRAAFAAGGLPDTRVEAWKYTALRGLGQRSFVSGDAAALTRAVDASILALPGVAGVWPALPVLVGFGVPNWSCCLSMSMSGMGSGKNIARHRGAADIGVYS